jgi:hypothetical protein
VSSSNVSGFECLELLVGYGRDATDMLVNQTYGLIYQIPASPPAFVAGLNNLSLCKCFLLAAANSAIGLV